jgi:hypothetical protein
MTMAPAVATLREKAAGMRTRCWQREASSGVRAPRSGRTQRVGKTRKIGRLVEDLNPDQAAAPRQPELGKAPPMIKRQMGRSLRRVRAHFERLFVGGDREHETCAEGMRRSEQIAEIDGLGDAFDADGEIAARRRKQAFHVAYLPQASVGQKSVERGLPRAFFPRISQHRGQALHFLADFGFPRGFVVPIHGPCGFVAGVALAGRKFDLSAQTNPTIHIITLYAFDRIHQLAVAKSETRLPLTLREREVLAWSAQGRSGWEIGEILQAYRRRARQDSHAQARRDDANAGCRHRHPESAFRALIRSRCGPGRGLARQPPSGRRELSRSDTCYNYRPRRSHGRFRFAWKVRAAHGAR